MIFDEVFLSSIPENPLSSCQKIIEEISNNVKSKKIKDYTCADYSYSAESFAILLSVMENFDISFNEKIPTLVGSYQKDTETILIYFSSIEREVSKNISIQKFELLKENFDGYFRGSIIYEISDDDIKKIKDTLSDIKKQINEISIFENDNKYKLRIIEKINNIEKVICKRISNINLLLDFIACGYIINEKFGDDGKPITSRIKDIADITWGIQSCAEGLSGDSPSPFKISS